MEARVTARVLFGLVLILFAGRGLYGADTRSAYIEVNVIIDGSAALSGEQDDIAAWISGNLVDSRLREGDRITIWNAGGKAEIVYSGTLKSDADKENVKKTLKSLSAGGDTADFAGALREAASRSTGKGITYTLLVSASQAALSSALQGPSADLIRFSRLEESRGWQALLIALNIDSRIRQAAAAYFAGT
ncbi:MAG: hypothetical protein LBD47_09190 [Treponema sp.]|jgi:hypothetical protein|nr:hypothetical protein [Treponema sp.]